MENYSEYLIQGEPNKHDRVRNWMAAIGLQDVDGLTPSNYMLEAVRRNIEGEITIDGTSIKLLESTSTAPENIADEYMRKIAKMAMLKNIEAPVLLLMSNTFSK